MKPFERAVPGSDHDVGAMHGALTVHGRDDLLANKEASASLG